MAHTGSTLLVQAWIDRDFDTERGWVARVLGDAPFHGLFATGEGFADARRNAARVVHEAHQAFRPDIAIEEVLVVASTRKTYQIDDLADAD